MDYYKMSKDELIQEILHLRSRLDQMQDNEFTLSANVKEGHIIQSSPNKVQSELFIRFSPDLKYTFVNQAYTYFLKQKRGAFIGSNVIASLPAEYQQKALDLLQTLSPVNPVATVEYTWLSNAGKTRWRRWTVRAIFDEKDSLIEYHAVGRDVTEHKAAEEEINQRLKIEHAITRTSKLLVGTEAADLNEMLKIIGEAMAVNRVYIFEFHDDMRKMTNTYEWCDANTPSVIEGLHNMDTEVFAWGLRHFLSGNNIVIADRNALPIDSGGEKQSMEEQGIYAALLVPITGIENNFLGYIGFDDTQQSRLWKDEDIQCLNMLAEMLGAYWERKKMEKALQVSEIRFRTLSETAPANIFVWEPNNENSLLYLNTGYTSISGYSKEEALAKNYWEFVHPDYRDILKIKGQARLRGENVPDHYEIKFIDKNGADLYGDVTVNTIEWDGKPAVIGVICDITERKQMEEHLQLAHDELETRVRERTSELLLVNKKLRQEIAERQQVEQDLLLSETRYRAIIENQAEMVVRALPDGSITFVNEAYCSYFGKNAAELMGQSITALFYEEDKGEVLNKLNQLSMDCMEDNLTLRAIRADGSICWQEWNCRAIVKDQENIEIQAVGRDVNERIMAEEALQRSEANFRKLAETSPALIPVYNEEGFLYVNSTFEKIMGYSREDLLQMSPWEPIHPDFRETAKINYFARQNGVKVPPYEILIQCKSGQQIWGYLYADTIDYEGQTATLGMIVDITERKRMEEDLLQASKLDSLGILAGGIAHDFNNILTVISGNVSLAKMIMKTDDEVADILSEVEQAALQARDLTQQLLTFSKGGAPIKETASIKELLQESCNFVLRGSNVICNYYIADDLWPVSIDKGQINQVISNLIINADQAMPEGGVIQLSAINISSDSDLPPSLKPADYIKIAIIDQGIGIVEKHLDKIFDPYFTTKQKGHGLGLATCYSIIKKHDGDINIISSIGIGTTVTVYLPALPDHVVELKNSPGYDLRGQGKILIMDDEVSVRETLGKMLQRLGYTISTAADGQKAINLYQNAIYSNEPYDAVMMDLTIAGGMGGKEAVKRLLEMDPEAKVIVSSGYSNDPVMAEYKNFGFCGVLPKPYEIQAVNQILHGLIKRQEAG